MNIRELKPELEKNGFIYLKRYIPKNLCEAVLENTVTLLSNYYPASKEIEEIEKPFNNPIFHSYMHELRKSNPELFGIIYDAAQSSVALDRIILFKSLTELIAKLLGIDIASLSSSGHIQKMEAPEDSKNLYDWHQEQSYYPQNRNGEHGLVVWIPLMDIPNDGGTLNISVGSHKEGFIKTKSEKKSEIHSIQNTVSNEIINKYRQVSFPVNQGDVFVAYMTTCHKSGVNETNNFRFNAIGRFHNAIKNDFAPFRYNYTFSQSCKKRLKNKGYNLSDLQ